MNKGTDETIHILTSHLFRENYGKMVSFLSQKYGYQEIDNILDAIQDAFEAALRKWKFTGIPDHQVAWLYKVANNKFLNRIKQSNTVEAYVKNQMTNGVDFFSYNEQEAEDSLLKLLLFFSKLHFSRRNKLIVSLYFLCGFSYDEISRALILNQETVKKVILRSKESIREISSRYDGFQIDSIGDELDHLLKVIYLLFNEGYKTSSKSGTINKYLCYEAIRLAKLVRKYDQDNPEINSLLALMFFNTSRFPARFVGDRWVSLEDQDRTRWDKRLILEGFYYLKQAKSMQSSLEKYYLQALISSLHCSSESYGKTNWEAISHLYQQLGKIEPDSVYLTLNRIICESNFKDIHELIDQLTTLENSVTDEASFAFFSTKAYLYSRLCEVDSAIVNYKRSLDFTKNKADIKFIQEKINRIDEENRMRQSVLHK